jgi:DNA-binding CsgD family transcriptional regulator
LPDGPAVVLRIHADAALARLSPAEREVVLAVLDGASNTAIAQRRGTSERTVANQLASIFRKLGASSRLDLVRTVVGRARLLAEPPAPGPELGQPDLRAAMPCSSSFV